VQAALWLVLAVVPPPDVAEVPRVPVPAQYELHWDAPSGCPDEAAIHARVAAWLSAPPAGEGTMIVHANVRGPDPRWRMALSTDFEGAVDTREVVGASCEEIGDSLALVLALALEPSLEPPVREGQRDEGEPLPVPSPRAPRESVAPSPRGPARRRAGVGLPIGALRVEAGLELGAVPGVAPTVAIAIGPLWPRLRLELSGRWIGPRVHATENGDTVRVQVGALAVRACLRPRLRRWEIPACLGLEAGAVRFDARGFPRDGTDHGPWLAPVVSAGLARWWRRLGLWVQGEVAIRAVGTQAVSGEDVVFVPGRASLRVVAGPSILLP
jgi:hypothetical protein